MTVTNNVETIHMYCFIVFHVFNIQVRQQCKFCKYVLTYDTLYMRKHLLTIMYSFVICIYIYRIKKTLAYNNAVFILFQALVARTISIVLAYVFTRVRTSWRRLTKLTSVQWFMILRARNESWKTLTTIWCLTILHICVTQISSPKFIVRIQNAS